MTPDMNRQTAFCRASASLSRISSFAIYSAARNFLCSPFLLLKSAGFREILRALLSFLWVPIFRPLRRSNGVQIRCPAAPSPFLESRKARTPARKPGRLPAPSAAPRKKFPVCALLFLAAEHWLPKRFFEVSWPAQTLKFPSPAFFLLIRFAKASLTRTFCCLSAARFHLGAAAPSPESFAVFPLSHIAERKQLRP